MASVSDHPFCGYSLAFVAPLQRLPSLSTASILALPDHLRCLTNHVLKILHILALLYSSRDSKLLNVATRLLLLRLLQVLKCQVQTSVVISQFMQKGPSTPFKLAPVMSVLVNHENSFVQHSQYFQDRLWILRLPLRFKRHKLRFLFH